MGVANILGGDHVAHHEINREPLDGEGVVETREADAEPVHARVDLQRRG